MHGAEKNMSWLSLIGTVIFVVFFSLMCCSCCCFCCCCRNCWLRNMRWVSHSEAMIQTTALVTQKSIRFSRTCLFLLFIFIVLYYYYRYSALGPVWAETRAQLGDWYVSGTLHPGQILRGSLPLLSPAFRSSHFRYHATFRDLLHAANLQHGTDGFTSPPKEGALRIFSPLKIRRFRPGLNPRTWVPKASTLPLDHQSRWFQIRHSKWRCHF